MDRVLSFVSYQSFLETWQIVLRVHQTHSFTMATFPLYVC